MGGRGGGGRRLASGVWRMGGVGMDMAVDIHQPRSFSRRIRGQGSGREATATAKATATGAAEGGRRLGSGASAGAP